MKRILITGANSYIGDSVRDYLLQEPDRYSVTIKDTIGWNPTPSDFEGYDVVFNVAGIAHIKETKKNRPLYYAVNRDLAISIAQAAKEAGVKQFILLSTMSVYGMTTGHITKETKPNPVNAYGKSKLQADRAINKIAKESNGEFQFACLRPPMVYGKGCKGNYQTLRSFALKSPVFPDYDNQRSMIYIGNLCEFVKQIIDKNKSGLFFPQNSDYVNTSLMVNQIAKCNGKKIAMTRLFNSILGFFPVNILKKVFGNLTYEKVDLVDKYGFISSIKNTEKKDSVLEKVTIIAGYYPPEQSADTRLNQELAESLSNKGISVTVIVPFPSRGVSEDIQKQYLDKRYERISEKLEIYRVGSPTVYSQSIITRGWSFLIKSFQVYKVAKNIESDICFVVSTPPTLGYIAARLSKKKNVIYKLQDAFPDSLMYSKNLSEHSFVIKVFRVLERIVYRKVTKICTVSDDLKKTIEGRGVPKDKITVIYDWIDENKCLPVNRDNNFLYDKFDLDRNKIYVAYAGNIGLLQNLETMVMASKRFITTNPELVFVIIGNGSWEKELDKLLKTGGFPNVRHYPLQPTEDIAYVYSLGDIGLVSLKPGITKIALPSKTWDIMSSGRAVLCEIDLYSGLKDIIEDNCVGICVKPNDVDGMENAIRKMISDMEETNRMGERGRSYICNNLTREIIVNRYIRYFEEIMEGKC